MNKNTVEENLKAVEEITQELDQLTKTQEQRINGQAARISLQHPFFSSLLLSMYRTPSWDVPTMATNGLRILWNPEFTSKLSDDEIRGVLVHECLHPGLGHLWRVHKDWDQRVANMAADYAINNFLDDYNSGMGDSSLRLLLPDGGCLDHKYDGMSMEHIYTLLMNDPKSKEKAQSYYSVGEVMQPGAGEPQDGDGESQDGDGEGSGSGAGAERPLDGRDASVWATRMNQAAQIAKAMGRMPANVGRIIGDLGKPDISWSEALSRFVEQNSADDFDWMLPDRRFLGAGFYLPGMRSDSMPPITAVLDTSGSVDESIMNRFAAELQDLMTRLKPDKLTVIHADAAVAGVEEFRAGDQIKLNPKGGGGTDFRPAFDYAAKECADSAVMIYFTDGYGTFPSEEPRFPVLWITYGLESRKYPFGEVITATL